MSESELPSHDAPTPEEEATVDVHLGVGSPAGDPYDDLLFVPDAYEPSMIDAQKTFAITVLGALIFMGAVAILIL